MNRTRTRGRPGPAGIRGFHGHGLSARAARGLLAIAATAALTLTAAASLGQDPRRSPPPGPTPDAGSHIAQDAGPDIAQDAGPDIAQDAGPDIAQDTAPPLPPAPPAAPLVLPSMKESPPPLSEEEKFWWRKPHWWSDPTYADSDKRDRPAVDPLLPTGIALTTMGMAGTLAGALLLVSANSHTGPCRQDVSTNSCRLRQDDDPKIAGVAGMAAGVGMMVIGIPAWALGAGADVLEPGKRHRNDKMRVTGAVLTAMGAATVGVGFGGLAGTEATGKRSGDALATALPLTIGGSLIATGVPLWARGSSQINEDELTGGVRGETRNQGPGMRNAGMALTLVGLGIGAAGVAVLTAGAEGGGRDSMATVYAGVPLSVLGGAMVLVGIPIWAVGAARYNSSSTQSRGPSLLVGPRSAALMGDF